MNSIFYSEATQSYQLLLQEYARNEKTLAKLPPGRLVIAQNKGNPKCYHVNDGKRTYLSKNNLDLVTQLAQKRYLRARQNDLKSEMLALSAYLDKHNSNPASPKLKGNESPIQSFLQVADVSSDKILQSFMEQTYEPNPFHPEHKIYKSSSGIYLRSKSEVLIEEILCKYDILHHYEMPLVLEDGTVIYPDFTMINRRTHQIFYWEHHGMMDVPKYAQNAASKQFQYAQNNIYPLINLIVTYETRNHPLDAQLVETMIKTFLL